MARTVNRSGKSGRFVTKGTARRSPGNTSTERVGRGTSNKTAVNKSLVTGRFVKASTAQRHPDTTITQKV
jgi:hypothetical protein